MKKSSIKRARLRYAFSLVETVLALGILGLAVTALLGLLPHGIEMTRQAANISALTRIVSNISSELSLMKFSDLASLPTTRLRFDEQGTLISNSQGFQAFLAEVKINNNGMLLPGSSAPTNLLPVAIIRVTATPNPSFNFEDNPQSAVQTIPVIFGPILQY